MGTKHEGVKIGIVQIVLFLVILGGAAFYVQTSLIPSAVSGFVVPLFEPSGDLRSKIGFIHFKDEGLLYASVSKENEELFGEEAQGIMVSKDKINGEYIFDFTTAERTSSDQGYSKKSNEFYIKSPVLGESAIWIEPMQAFVIISIVIGFFVSNVTYNANASKFRFDGSNFCESN